jgi:hypothetical protein
MANCLEEERACNQIVPAGYHRKQPGLKHTGGKKSKAMHAETTHTNRDIRKIKKKGRIIQHRIRHRNWMS